MPTELKRTKLSVRRERAVLMQLSTGGGRNDSEGRLAELGSLAKTAGARVVGQMVQRHRRINPALYIGKGKAKQLGQKVHESDADVVIFDNDLTPGQIRDLEEIVECKVLDRSELILDIFATRARTSEARLQVELAQLEYTYPRLTRMWTHLDRLDGGSPVGIGTRGPGEKQLEVDRRIVRKRIDRLKARIAQIDSRKVRTIRNRDGVFTACLVGYTNAGKSTLMNALTGAGVRVEDKLFATLDTRTRRWELGGGRFVLLSDTVGFVRDLPHHLIASFRATLEEALNADCLIHVAYASHPDVPEQVEAVNAVLTELGCQDKNQVLALNKIDAMTDHAPIQVLQHQSPDALTLSARKETGLDRLLQKISDLAKEKKNAL